MAEDAVAGTSGRALARVDLPADKTEVTFSVKLSEAKRDTQIRIYYGGGTFRITNVVTKRAGYCTDHLWNLLFLLVILALLIWLFFWRYRGEEKRTSRLVTFVLTLSCITICLPLANDFLLFGHDIGFHLGRLDGIAQAIENGFSPFYLNMPLQNGYGYLSSVMYPQLFLYLPSLLMCCGMSLMNAYKILLASIGISGILIAYFSFRGIFHSRGAAVCTALAYNFCIYRLSDTYVRAAIGESLAMCFLPLVFYGFYEIYDFDAKREAIF